MTLKREELEAQRRLIERAKLDADAFGEIFDSHYEMIVNYLVRRTGDVALAEDIASEVFVKAMRALPSFEWRGVPISAWLYRIAGNELKMYYRKKRFVSSLEEMREHDGFEPISDVDLAAEQQAAQDEIERNVEFRHAQELIANMPLKYQEVLVLRFGEQKKTREIAQILGKSEGTVKSLLSRAMAKLRKDATNHSRSHYDMRRKLQGES